MDIRTRIQMVLDEKGLTPRAVSLKAGLSDSMLGKFLKGETAKGGTKSMTVDNLEAVAKAMEVSFRWLLFGEHEDEKVAYLWDHIPERRRQQALRVLETFADDESQAGSA